jgi:flagellar protein FliO/FliZ
VTPDSPLHAILGLGFVLALILGAAYLLKRVQPARFGGSKLLKLIAQLGVGTRERIVVIEIGDQWLVLGVTPGSIRTLHTTPKSNVPEKPESGERTPFSAWLARAKAHGDAPHA